MDYYSTIKALYPDILNSEFLLQDDNGVISILRWTYQGAAQPTIEYLQSQGAAGDLWFAKSQKMELLNASCADAITGGFSSSALGSANTYPSKEDSASGQFDQTNLLHAVSTSLIPGLPGGWTTPLWCENSSNVWSFAPHTAAQVQQVMEDFLTAKSSYQSHLATLSAEVTAATTVDEVNAINW